MKNWNLKIDKTTYPEKPTKNIDEWAKYLFKNGCRLSSSYNYNLKELSPIRLKGK